MFDTVVASIEVDLSDTSMFPHRSQTDNVIRMWRNPTGEYQPRLTYWCGIDGKHGRLRIEFSVPKMAGIDPLCNPTEADVVQALSLVDNFMWLDLLMAVPPIVYWQTQRIDYAWNFEPTEGVADYILMLQGLWLGRMSRHPHPDAEGVVWKSKQANHRWVKFYNKTREAGSKGTPVLRFEVSNYRRSLSYMCKHWLGCGRTVGELVHPGRALYVMARIWSQLGLFSATYDAKAGLVLKLKALFGNAAPNAFYALMCISTYGADTHKLHGLMSSNTYYTWKHKLSEHGLLCASDVVLPPLALPVLETLKMIEAGGSQDLRNFPLAVGVPSSKISPKNWEFWAKILQIAPTAPEIGLFTQQLELSLECLYAEKPTKLGRVREDDRRTGVKAAS